VRTITFGNQQILALALLALMAFGGSYLLSHAEVGVGFLVAVALVVGVVSFLRAELAIYLLIIAMLLSPQFAAGAESAARGKGVTLRFDDFLLVVVGIAWFLKSALYKELNLLAHTPVNHAAFFYSVACIVSTLVGIQSGDVQPLVGSLFVLKYLEYFLLFWMVINNTQDERQVRRFLFVLFAVAVIVSIVAILQIPSGVRVTAPFEGSKGEPNTLGGYLLFILTLMMGIALTCKEYRKLLTLSIGILFIPFVFTLSRASYLALPVALLSLLFLTRKLKLAIALVAISLVLTAFPSLLPRAVTDRIEFTFKQRPQPGQVTVMGRRLDTSTSARIQSFSESLDAFRLKPLLGWGVTGWGFIDSQFIRALVETGLVGLGALLYLLFRVLIMARNTLEKVREKDQFYYGLTCGFIAGTSGLIVHALGSNTFIIVRIMEPFWLVCAMIFLLPQLLNKKESEVIPAYAPHYGEYGAVSP
jgi:O-antigen ligase